jgi:hypothetical protein
MKTKCFTYEVKMIVQVLADDETSASEKLDREGGYVSDRKTKLVAATALSKGLKAAE